MYLWLQVSPQGGWRHGLSWYMCLRAALQRSNQWTQVSLSLSKQVNVTYNFASLSLIVLSDSLQQFVMQFLYRLSPLLRDAARRVHTGMRRLFQMMVATQVSEQLLQGVEPGKVKIKFETAYVKPTLLDGFAQALANIKQEDALHFFSDETTRICQVRIKLYLFECVVIYIFSD